MDAMLAVVELNGQAVHGASPTVSLYAVTAQAEHSPPSGPVKPELHWQATSAVDALADVAWLGHAEHASSANDGLYLPGEHAEHAPAGSRSELVFSYPARQLHSEMLVLPRASVDENARHCVHAALPSPGLYWPLAHDRQ